MSNHQVQSLRKSLKPPAPTISTVSSPQCYPTPGVPTDQPPNTINQYVLCWCNGSSSGRTGCQNDSVQHCQQELTRITFDDRHLIQQNSTVPDTTKRVKTNFMGRPETMTCSTLKSRSSRRLTRLFVARTRSCYVYKCIGYLAYI